MPFEAVTHEAEDQALDRFNEIEAVAAVHRYTLNLLVDHYPDLYDASRGAHEAAVNAARASLHAALKERKEVRSLANRAKLRTCFAG